MPHPTSHGRREALNTKIVAPMHYVFDSSVCLCVCHVTAWADPAHHVGGGEGQDCYFGSEARERGGVLGEG